MAYKGQSWGGELGGALSSRLGVGGEFVWRVVGSSGKVEPSALSVGGGGSALEARPAPTLGQPSSCCLPAVPGRGRAGEAAVHEGAAGVPAVRSLQDVHGEDPGKEDQERWEGPRPQAASACSWMGGSGQAIPHPGLTLWGWGGGCSRQGEHHMTTCRARPCQRRPGRLTLPSLLPRQRTPAPGSRTPS